MKKIISLMLIVLSLIKEHFADINRFLIEKIVFPDIDRLIIKRIISSDIDRLITEKDYCR
jgi:hypothetical protein